MNVYLRGFFSLPFYFCFPFVFVPFHFSSSPTRDPHDRERRYPLMPLPVDYNNIPNTNVGLHRTEYIYAQNLYQEETSTYLQWRNFCVECNRTTSLKVAGTRNDSIVLLGYRGLFLQSHYPQWIGKHPFPSDICYFPRRPNVSPQAQ